MDFALPQSLVAMQRAVRDFAASEIAPIAAALDREPRFPWETLRKMGDLGLLGVATPEEYGGAGLDYLSLVVLLEEVAAADASHATIMSVTNGLPQSLLVKHGTEAQRQRYLPRLASGEWIGAFCLSEASSGSDAASLSTRAVKVEGGYLLNGSKAWTTSGGEAQLYLVLAKTDPQAGARGITCFLVEKDNPGVSFGRPEEKLGQHAAITTSVNLDDCFVADDAVLGAPGAGFVIAMAGLDGGRIGIAALSVGIARAAFEVARDYAAERTAFGTAIHEFQAIGFKLADMVVGIESARLLTYRAAWRKDRGFRTNREAPRRHPGAGRLRLHQGVPRGALLPRRARDRDLRGNQ